MATSPQVDLHLTGDQISIHDMVALARAAENAGMGRVWVAEAFRDAVVPLAAIAGATATVGIGTNIAQWTRTLPTLELTAGDLAEWSGARFVLGLGSTTKEWNEDWHQIPYERPLRRMREYVEGVRALWTASALKPVSYAGEMFQVTGYQRFNGPLEVDVPIYLGATRSGMARLAGEIADGVNFNVLMSPEYIREAMLPSVAEGAEIAGRNPSEVARGVLVITAVSHDREQAFRWAKQQVAFYVGVASYFDGPLRFHGFDHEIAEIKGACSRGDLFGAFGMVTDDMVNHLTMAGTPDEVRESLTRYQGVVDFVMTYQPSFLVPPDEIRQGHEQMIAAFGA